MSKPTRYFKPAVSYALWGLCGLAIIGLLGLRAHLVKPTPVVAPKAAVVQTKAAAKPAAKPEAKPVAKADLSAKLKQDWQKVLADSEVPVSIAVYAKQSDTTVAYNNPPKTPHTTASIVKVAMLTELLHKHRESGAKLTSAEVGNAELAIQNSDNGAATRLYHAINSAQGLASLFANLKMSDSQASAGGWVRTTTTASDQLKLLNQIFYPNDYLTTKSQAYIQDLMGKVEPDQQWGVSAGAKTYQLKNGWRLNGDDTWIVNSIGHLGTGANSCTIAILTDRNRSLEAGQQLVEKLAKVTGQDLNLR